LPLGFSTPDLHKFLFDYANSQINQILLDLKPRAYDVVISNTLVCLHGPLIARELNVPHIFWAHENLNADIDLATRGFSPNFYIKVLSNLSSHIICGSKYTESLFNKNEISTSVLYPFTPYDDLKNKFTNYSIILLSVITVLFMVITVGRFCYEVPIILGILCLGINLSFKSSFIKSITQKIKNYIR
jgi:hypothetical protein